MNQHHLRALATATIAWTTLAGCGEGGNGPSEDVERGTLAVSAPIGQHDGIKPASGTAQFTWGWACDPDDWSRAVDVHFYLDGTYETGTFVGSATASGNRPDVGGVCGGTTNHGFDFSLPTAQLSSGTHTLHAYAIDPENVSGNPMLGGGPLTFVVEGGGGGGGGSAPAQGAPSGQLDGITPSGGGTHFAWGWACDGDDWNAPVEIHFYLDGTYDSGTFVGSTVANVQRNDVGGACGGTTAHGFEYVLPTSHLANGAHTLYAYAVDPQGAAGNPALGGSPMSLAVTDGSGGGGGSGGGTGGGAGTLHGWDPFVRTACYRALGTVEPRWSGSGSDCTGTTGAWSFGTTNETAQFSDGGLYDFWVGHPIWSFGFIPDPSGHYTVDWAIDKVNHDHFRDRYSFAGFDDTSLSVPLGGDVRVSLEASLKAVEQYDDGVNGMAKNRVMVGAVGTWNGRSHFLEVNLWRSANFDLCTGACDPGGAVDRVFGQPGWPAEGVYYHAPAIGLPSLAEGAGRREYEIHLASLFRSYGGWTDPPANWDQALLTGIYIGVEVWGKGRVWMEHQHYRTWSP